MTEFSLFIPWLQQRLTKPLPGYEAQQKMMNLRRPRVHEAPATARVSAVLILLYPQWNNTFTVLIERSADGGVHGGQIALPGGKKEDSDNDITHTALREAAEEIALNAHTVQTIGNLTPLYIPVSNFIVHPVLGICEEKPQLIASEYEVASILQLPLATVFSNKEKVTVTTGIEGLHMQALAYLLPQREVVWGATAMILSELEVLWREFRMSSSLDSRP
jgi:8-oxo-dGTP pyrophosphatase MutT (NUDIX family)